MDSIFSDVRHSRQKQTGEEALGSESTGEEATVLVPSMLTSWSGS